MLAEMFRVYSPSATAYRLTQGRRSCSTPTTCRDSSATSGKCCVAL